MLIVEARVCQACTDEVAVHHFPAFIVALRKLGRNVDVEVSGHFLLIYSTRRFAFPRPGALKDVFAIISLVSAQAGTA